MVFLLLLFGLFNNTSTSILVRSYTHITCNPERTSLLKHRTFSNSPLFVSVSLSLSVWCAVCQQKINYLKLITSFIIEFCYLNDYNLIVLLFSFDFFLFVIIRLTNIYNSLNRIYRAICCVLNTI